jgi:hypothetical protein
MKYKELAKKYFPEITPASASIRLTREIKKTPGLNKEFAATLGRDSRPRLLTLKQIKLIKSYLGPLPKGRKRSTNSVPASNPVSKTTPVAITGVTLHRGAGAPPVKIEWEERDGKIFIGGIEAETVNPKEIKTHRSETECFDRIIQTMALMQKDRGNCITLTRSTFPQMTNYKVPAHFAGYCIAKYFKKYPERRKTEAFKAKKGLSEGTARIIKIH